MADVLIVACPECKKKFKPKTDVRGKKIKCPFCKAPFTVPSAKKEPAKAAAGKSADDKSTAVKPEDPNAAAEQKAAEMYDEFDENPDPYGVKHVDLVPRCPNCTQEMGEHDTICLFCGYNTLTRQWGETKKVKGLTFGRHLLYLLPAIGAAIFTVLLITSLIFFDVIGPYWLPATMFWWIDTEAMRLFNTVDTLTLSFSAGVYCFKKFIEKPKPDDIIME
jgi:hypothetical protein